VQHVDCAALVSLTLAPFDKSLPNEVVGSLTYDSSDRVWISAEVSLNSLIAEVFDIKVAIGGTIASTLARIKMVIHFFQNKKLYCYNFNSNSNLINEDTPYICNR